MWVRNNRYVALKTAAIITTSSATPSVYADLSTFVVSKNRSAMAVISLGSLTTATTATFALYECDTTNGTYTACVAGTTSKVSTTTTGDLIQMPFYPTMRYVQLQYSINATDSAALAAMVVGVATESSVG